MLPIFFLLLTGGIALVSSQTNYRLPDTIRPSHYDVFINTDFETFSGTVSITLQTLQPSASITLHSKDLALTNVRFTNRPAGSNIVVQGFTAQSETDFISINLSGNMIANQSYILALEFSGTLGSESHVGLYKAVYQDENNLPRELVTTQFEPTYARRAFPCFDQPNFKATFQIRLVRDPSLRTTSNSFLESSLPWDLDNTKILDVYTRTPVMSTYLVAFTISDYERVFDGTYSVYGRKQLLDRGEGEYALRIGKAAIEAMAAFTGINYSLLKLDQFAVPNEFYQFGAMENWGMVTYRERYLMYNENTSTAAENQNAATIIAHELAHQWFGNLVTPKWWNHIWLNEGFATYFEIFITNQLEPEWNIMQQFASSYLQSAFNADALESTRAITTDAESPDAVMALFDTIAYDKAGSVIRMFAHFLGENVFRDGLQRYLTEWGMNNVEPANLYSSWQAALANPNINLAEIAATWETQKGFPVVTVTRNYTSNFMQIKQERFFLTINATDDTRWLIPINWFSSGAGVTPYILLSADTNVNVQIPEANWIIFNHQRTGFYRVNYDAENWRLITNALLANRASIPVENRAQVIDDSFNLARAEIINYNIPLDLAKYLANETEYVPISTFTSNLNYLHRITTGTLLNSYIKSYGLSILGQIYDRIGFDILQTDSHLSKLTKVNVLTWLCNMGHEECRSKSHEALSTSLETGTPIQADSQNFVYCNALRQGEDPVYWAHLYTTYIQSRSDTQRGRIATALGCVNDELLLRTTLDFLILETPVFTATDRVSVINSIISNNEVLGLEIVLDFLTTNFVVANERIGSMSSIVNAIASRVTNPDLLSLFRAFRDANNANFSESMRATVATAIATAEDNIAWIQTMSLRFQNYFSDGVPDSSTAVASQIFIVIGCALMWLLH